MKKRHQGVFNPEHPAPYELSRSRVNNYLRCKACFWLTQKHGVKVPETPSMTLNTNTDILLKRDADAVRGKKSLPIWEAAGLGHLIPFEHEDLEKWTNSLQYGLNDRYFNTIHEETNIKFGGGLDDVFYNTETGQLHIVDYKSQCQGTKSPENYKPKPSSIDDSWKIDYKRQMDMYVWLLRRKGFDVSNSSYFLYVDGQHKGVKGMLIDEDPSIAWMKFNTIILPYEADTSWVEPMLYEIKDFLLNQKTCPEHAVATKENPYARCENGRWLNEAMEVLGR